MIAEIRNRLVKAKEFLGNAMRADPETDALVIVHAGYYAMFHAALAVLVDRLPNPPTKHSAVVGGFGRIAKEMGEEGKVHGRAINKVQELRVAADYAPDTMPTPEQAEKARRDAEAFVAFCDQLLDGRL